MAFCGEGESCAVGLEIYTGLSPFLRKIIQNWSGSLGREN
jgi:hypothetical protein